MINNRGTQVPISNNRKGGALIEVMVALTLFSIVMGSLGAFALTVAASNKRISLNTQRAAATQQTVLRMEALPYDSLASRAGCTTITTGTYSRQECITIQNINANIKRVMIVVTPNHVLLKPDTTYFDRGKSNKGNPLNVQ